MTDLYRDFCFTALATAVDDSQTDWFVDDVTGFPSNALLAKGDFWLAVEAPLTHPPAFEIVKLTNVDIDNGILTVVRAQQGTSAQPHDSGVLVKGTLTAAMLRQARGALYGPSTPPCDSDLYQVGDRFHNNAEGVFYRYTGKAPFIAQTNFTNTITGSQNLPDPYFGSGSWRSGAKLRWSNVAGVIVGAPDTDDRHGAAIPLTPAVSADRAIALLNVGASEYGVIVFMNTPSGSTADAGLLLCASPDGSNGLYLSVAPGSPPQLRPLVDGVLGVSLGGIGTVDVPASSYIQLSVEMDGSDVTIWYQSFSDLVNGFSAHATFSVTTTGTFGFMANSLDAFTDPLLSWNQVEVQYSRIGRSDALTNVTETFSRTDATGTPADEPTSVPRFAPFTRDWNNAIGVWGITDPDGSGQAARYQSGAVSNRALLYQDMRSRVSDIEYVLSVPADIGALDFGVLVFGTDDGRNGLYVRLIGDHSAICAVVDGEAQSTELASGNAPSNSGTIVLRIVTSDSDIIVIDLGADVVDTVLLRMSLDRVGSTLSLREFGGTWSGVLLANAETLAANIALRQVSYYDTYLPAGWEPEVSVSHGARAPQSTRPPGSLFVNEQGGLYYATGAGDWVPLNAATPDWQFLSPSAPWTTNGPVQFYQDRDRTYLRGSVVFADVDAPDAHPVFDSTAMDLLKLDGTHTVALPTHDISTGAWGMAYVAFGAEANVVGGYASGAVLFLDGVSWRHT